MGNAAAKESRGDGDVNMAVMSRDLILGAQGPLSGISRRKRERDKERRKHKEEHIADMIVRYEENVDGGYLAPYGNYKYGLSYKTNVVRDLIVERRLAPFYTPLEEFDPGWTDEQLLQHLRALPLHVICTESDMEDADEDPDEHKIYQSSSANRRHDNKVFKRRLKEKAVKLQNDGSGRYARDKQTQVSGIKTFKDIPSDDLLLRLYRDAEECPICFLFYPKLMNMTRCCDQPICTECFVQMKRLDPHVPHDEPGTTDVPATTDAPSNPDDLISEPVKCPFCAMTEFGVTYDPPEFRTGIGGIPPGDYRNNTEDAIDEEDAANTAAVGTSPKTKVSAQHSRTLSAVSKARSLSGSGPGPRKRRGSLPPTSSQVVTIDMIYPDWEQRLLSARAKLARRSAAATALHASSLIVEGRGANGQPLAESSSESSIQPEVIHHDIFGVRRRSSPARVLSRQEQMEIEQRMIEQALRLSIIDEEERKMKEKEKKREKDEKSEHKKMQRELKHK